MVRRMERALVRRDIRTATDPLRAQTRSLVVGVVLAVLGLAACGVLALLRPHQGIGDHPIVVAKESGSLYVVLGDRVHPALNLASARLAVGAGGGAGDCRGIRTRAPPAGTAGRDPRRAGGVAVR